MPETSAGLSLAGNLRRDARIIGLLFASTTSMIGSGWLFGSYHAAKIAGPYAIWSWVVGAVIIMLIALCFAELGALFPRSGALGFWPAVVLVAIWSLVVLTLAQNSAISPEESEAMMQRM